LENTPIEVRPTAGPWSGYPALGGTGVWWPWPPRTGATGLRRNAPAVRCSDRKNWSTPSRGHWPSKRPPAKKIFGGEKSAKKLESP